MVISQISTVNVLIFLQMICIEKNELLVIIKMVKLLHLELQRRTIAHHCEWIGSDFMTHLEIERYFLERDRKEVLKQFYT